MHQQRGDETEKSIGGDLRYSQSGGKLPSTIVLVSAVWLNASIK
jgi:hypothetical protein